MGATYRSLAALAWSAMLLRRMKDEVTINFIKGSLRGHVNEHGLREINCVGSIIFSNKFRGSIKRIKSIYPRNRCNLDRGALS
jgi:hypothetical protein